MRSILLTSLLSIAASWARAEEPAPAGQDVEFSRRLFLAGQHAFEAGRYGEAASLFEQAFNESPRPALLWNAATAHRRLFDEGGDLAELHRARTQYERFAALSPSDAERDEAQRQIQKIQEIDRHLKEVARPAPPVAAPPAAHHGRWWVWTIVGGAVVVGAGVGLGVGLSERGGPPSTNGGNFQPVFQ
jgi:hypothetical protein